MAVVVLDIQHGCTPLRERDDTGARGPDGALERDVAGSYAQIAAFLLRDAGHLAYVLPGPSKMSITERWRFAEENKAKVYIACHVNSGGGKYGACFYRFDREDDGKLAKTIEDQAKRAPLPGIKWLTFKAKTKLEPGEIASTRSPGYHWTYEAWNCISGSRAAAVTFEPFFLDCPEHALYRSVAGTRFIAQHLAAGIIAFLNLKP